ncbi:probable G-protein coupled receptor 160 [Cololabis saira]|uniref:probable G-protein coupled receptor 160 n=1 Tax=Cololabis saira TaxID=129043 RepID=UPI002AD53EDB|nr:probable G-protein coupled receptor 160 [Cololabis saira]XP_061592508.1 probable G-protein coupled receptor 160 [Cololabis saira]XP_061592509.1 probable G-protein coupled receptor 160 [Cololabis saira]
MLPGSSSSSTDINLGDKMLAVLEQWDDASGCHTSNIGKYFALLLFKSGLDTVVFFVCSRKKYTHFPSMCSLSITLADLLLTFLLAAVWLLGAERSFVSPCYLLANASAIYGALPLPMMCLGLLDYCSEETRLRNQTAFCKLLRNVVLTLLVWMYGVIYSFGSVTAEQKELDYLGGKALVCEVEESTLTKVFILGLFTASLFALLPFWSSIPRWVREADKIYEAQEAQKNQRSDLFFTQSAETKSSEENYQENISPRPPMCFSLTLAFLMFWMPYLVMSVACLICGIAVPAYISVNLLWLECFNSLLEGVAFWVKSKSQMPYSNLPENLCSWQVYWHLSKGVGQPQLSAAIFNPSEEETLYSISVCKEIPSKYVISREALP